MFTRLGPVISNHSNEGEENMKKPRKCFPMLMLAALLAAGAAVAGPHDHQDGLFLRLSTGGGVASSSVTDSQGQWKISGAAVDLNLAIGAMVSPNLALHGTLYGWSTRDPDLEFEAIKVGEAAGDVAAAGLGVGLTYYFMPTNLYLSGSVGVGQLSLDDHSVTEGTDTGVLLDLTVGKEWWVGDNWGLGVAGGLTYHSFNDPDLEESWSGTSFCIRFSASRN